MYHPLLWYNENVSQTLYFIGVCSFRLESCTIPTIAKPLLYPEGFDFFEKYPESGILTPILNKFFPSPSIVKYGTMVKGLYIFENVVII